jgi:hypothetical protein
MSRCSHRVGASAFVSVQITGEGHRSHRPVVGAAAAETNTVPANRLRVRRPLSPATPLPLVPASRTASSRSCEGSSAVSGSRPPRCRWAGVTGDSLGSLSGTGPSPHAPTHPPKPPRIVIGATPRRRPQEGGARSQAAHDLADMTRPGPAQPALARDPFTIREDECMSRPFAIPAGRPCRRGCDDGE